MCCCGFEISSSEVIFLTSKSNKILLETGIFGALSWSKICVVLIREYRSIKLFLTLVCAVGFIIRLISVSAYIALLQFRAVMLCANWSCEKISTLVMFRAKWKNTVVVQWIRSECFLGEHLVHWTSVVFSHIALRWTPFAYFHRVALWDVTLMWHHISVVLDVRKQGLCTWDTCSVNACLPVTCHQSLPKLIWEVYKIITQKNTKPKWPVTEPQWPSRHQGIREETSARKSNRCWSSVHHTGPASTWHWTNIDPPLSLLCQQQGLSYSGRHLVPQKGHLACLRSWSRWM